MGALIAVVLCLFAGVALRFVRAFPGETAIPALNAFAIYVALPAVIVRQIPTLHASGAGLLVPALVPWVLLALSAGLIALVARRLRWSREVTRALMMVVPLGNTAFIGLPLVSALAGPDALPYAILYDQLGSFLALTIYGAFITAAPRAPATPAVPAAPAPDGPWAPAVGVSQDPTARVTATGPSAAPSSASPASIEHPLRAALGRVLVFPPFVALVLGLGLLVAQVALPPLVAGALDKIGASLVPTTLVAVGLGWRFTLPAGDRAPFGLALGLKLVALPALAWVLLAWLAPPAPIAHATLLQAGMGPMITAGALAAQAGLAPRLVAAIVGWGTFASLLTVPLWALLT
ncbi:MAG: AEC family transporter [Deltaproteobacteria bacterium]|nr:AEC family transporter [Deltaproteobacteria bacterium]